MSSWRGFATGGLCLLVLGLSALSAPAEMHVGVREFVPQDAGSANTAAGMRDMLFNDLAAQILEAAAKRRCDVSMIDISPRGEAACQTEKRLQ
jgi:hypothetical protein